MLAGLGWVGFTHHAIAPAAPGAKQLPSNGSLEALEFVPKGLPLAGTLIAAALSPMLNAADPAAQQFWPQWRGPNATGVAPQATPPLEWS